MMRSIHSTLLCSLLGAGLLGACGAAGDSGELLPDGGPPSPCEVEISFDPALPSVGVTTVASAVIDGSTGLRTFEWLVFFTGDPSGDVEVPVSPSGTGSAQISFTPQVEGSYQVIAYGKVDGQSCLAANDVIYVAATPPVTYRLRLVPGANHPAPVQERLIDLPAADFDLRDLQLENGIEVTGTVRDSAGAPLPAAYVRAVPLVAGTPAFLEAFADEQGGFAMRLQNLLYDVLVVPAGAGAPPPALFRGSQATSSIQLSLPPAVAVTGVVTGPDGTSMGGATVSINTGQLPSVISTVERSGAFAIQTRLDQDVSVTLVPPPGSDLPQLELPASPALTAALQTGATTLDIAYASSVSMQTITPTAILADDSTPVLGARAVWIARATQDAGEITAGDGTPLVATGTRRLIVPPEPDGSWPAITLPAAVYDVIIEPPPASGEPASLLEVDLTGDTPSSTTLSMVPHATLRGTVTSAAGSGLGQVRVTARPKGLLAQSTGARPSTTTAADGSFTLAVAAGSEYDLILESASRALGRQRLAVDGLMPGQSMDLGILPLPDTYQITGRVSLPGGASLAGVSLQLLCSGCQGPASTEPLAVAVSDATGQFVLFLPEVP